MAAAKTKKPGSQRHLNNPRLKARRTNAAARQAEAAKRSPEEQLKRLDEILGPGRGAKKERAKLAARIAAAKQQPVTEKPKKKDGKKS